MRKMWYKDSASQPAGSERFVEQEKRTKMNYTFANRISGLLMICPSISNSIKGQLLVCG